MSLFNQKNYYLSEICVHKIIILQPNKRSQWDLDDLLHKCEEFVFVLIEWTKWIDMFDIRVKLMHQINCENLS